VTAEQPSALLRLRVTAEADPGALACVIARFQNVNVVPRRVVAEYGINDRIHIQVDIVGISEDRLSLIAAKLREATSILQAYWHYP
jgi:hypothetical protein